METLLATAGVRDARLHDARHTAASLMLESGVPARAIMQVLGHGDIKVTLDTYAHVTPQLDEDAAEAMGHRLSGNRHVPPG